jgi:hypothetical protein
MNCPYRGFSTAIRSIIKYLILDRPQERLNHSISDSYLCCTYEKIQPLIKNKITILMQTWLTDKSLEEEGERATPAVGGDLTNGKENQHSGETISPHQNAKKSKSSLQCLESVDQSTE